MQRSEWIRRLVPLATPPLSALAEGRLLADIPFPEAAAGPYLRREFAALEILSRTLLGLAPWLEVIEVPENEAPDRERMRQLALAALERSLDPASPDRLDFTTGRPPLVNAAFLAQAFLNAPHALYDALSPEARERLVAGWLACRQIEPYDNNWHLFASLVEAALHRFTGDLQPDRVETAVRKHAAWYVGDGTYGDGPEFRWDYYNSFVIHPLLLDTLAHLQDALPDLPLKHAQALRRARRFAQVQERMIAADGTFPPLGRSLPYRCGAFHHLAYLAFRNQLPTTLAPAAVRGALGAVIRRTLDAPGTFDDRGWLRVGLSGNQPSLAEPYISVPSCYLCTAAFLPLGLPADAPFWTDPDAPWTSVRIWQGDDLPADRALARH
jgi:hypothetical protein